MQIPETTEDGWRACVISSNVLASCRKHRPAPLPFPSLPLSIVYSVSSYAKIHYLLSKSQVEKLPTIYADPTNETGKIITICSAAKASAVAR